MKEAKHMIKGPWYFYTSPQPNGCPIVGDSESGMMICQVAHSINEPGHAEIALARARLIAAAPELLVALETLAEYFEYCMGDNECRPLVNAYAAIAKATGRADSADGEQKGKQ